MTDEFHQSFVKSRSASVRDVLIDSGGAISGVLIGAAFGGRGSKKVEESPPKSLMRDYDLADRVRIVACLYLEVNEIIGVNPRARLKGQGVTIRTFGKNESG